MTACVVPVAGATLGEVITDIDLPHLSGQAWRAVEEAFLEYAMLVLLSAADAAAQALVGKLLQHACRPPRVLQATRITGDPATELAPTTRDERAADFQPSSSNCWR